MTDVLHVFTGAMWGVTAALLPFLAYFLYRIFEAPLSRAGHWLWLRYTPAGHREQERRAEQEAAFRAWCETPEAVEVARRMVEVGQSWGVTCEEAMRNAEAMHEALKNPVVTAILNVRSRETQ
ncbi:hypothetical protein AB0I28_12510 [Phytomonospora sp. NPDC050363]|uniref:hypothetical protein n=1 Tax=Phytomonospora sp. NPDC050363 TaxID=3155642 RepID=UPI003400B042